MRSLLAAILSLFFPPRGAHRTDAPPSVTVSPLVPPHQSAPGCRQRLHPADFIAADGQPLVRPYVVAWERERDQHEWRCFPWDVAV